MNDPGHFQTGNTGHAHVDNHQVVVRGAQTRDRLVAGRDLIDLKTVRFEGLREKLATDFVVIRDQYAGGHFFLFPR